MTINEDGTCVIDGTSGTWEFSDETRDDFLKINIFIEEEHCFDAGYYDTYKSIAVWRADYQGGIDASWRNMSTTEVITLTIENWQDYLEIHTYAEPAMNAFDEVERLTINTSLVLKEGYADRYIESDAVIEVKKSGQNATAVEYNTETGELVLTPADDVSDKEWTEIIELNQYSENGFGLGISMGTNSDTLEENGNIVTAVSQFYKYIEILRIKGELYLEK